MQFVGDAALYRFAQSFPALDIFEQLIVRFLKTGVIRDQRLDLPANLPQQCKDFRSVVLILIAQCIELSQRFLQTSHALVQIGICKQAKKQGDLPLPEDQSPDGDCANNQRDDIREKFRELCDFQINLTKIREYKTGRALSPWEGVNAGGMPQ